MPKKLRLSVLRDKVIACYIYILQVSIFVITKGFINILLKYGISFPGVSDILIDVYLVA